MLLKCLKCNRIFTMKKVEKKLVCKEDINIAQTFTQPHPSGEIQAVEERFVAGERRFYEVIYECRFCGAQRIESVFKNIKQG